MSHCQLKYCIKRKLTNKTQLPSIISSFYRWIDSFIQFVIVFNSKFLWFSSQWNCWCSIWCLDWAKDSSGLSVHTAYVYDVICIISFYLNVDLIFFANPCQNEIFSVQRNRLRKINKNVSHRLHMELLSSFVQKYWWLIAYNTKHQPKYKYKSKHRIR